MSRINWRSPENQHVKPSVHGSAEILSLLWYTLEMAPSALPQISCDSTEQQTLPLQVTQRPSSQCGFHVWSTPSTDWLSTPSLEQQHGAPTRSERSTETEGRDRPLCLSVLISLGCASGGRQRWSDYVCVCVRMAGLTGGAERHIPRRADWLLGPRCSAFFVRALSADSSQRAHTLLQ